MLNQSVSTAERRSPVRGVRGFSLIELLVVIGLIAVIFTLVVPAASSMMMGSKVTSSANQFVGALDVARQTAIARNRTIEVRFYKYANPDVPGEIAGNPATWRYRAYQMIEYLESGAAVQFGKLEQLPVGVSFDSGSISSILQETRVKVFTETDPKIELPRIGKDYSCTSFCFFGSGSTDLGFPANGWYVTLHRDTDGDNRQEPPANYVTVQVDPISGTVKMHRPGI